MVLAHAPSRSERPLLYRRPMRSRPITTTGAAESTPGSDRKTVRLQSRSAIGLLLVAGAALVAAFEPAPRVLLRPTFGAYGDAKLHDALGRALVRYWRSGTPAFPASLTKLVDYWFQWHAIKVAISSLSVIVFALLATALWQRYLRTQAWYAAVAIAATVSTGAATGGLVV